MRSFLVAALALMSVLSVTEVEKAQADSSFTVQNKTCKKMDYVTVDGQSHPSLEPGSSSTYDVTAMCNHRIIAGSGSSLWRNTSACKSSPYENQTMNLVDNVRSNDTLPSKIIDIGKEEYGNAGRIVVTNKSDCIVIQDIKANRGNCKVVPQQLRIPMKFGEQSSYVFYCARILEVEIDTNMGNDTFEWN